MKGLKNNIFAILKSQDGANIIIEGWLLFINGGTKIGRCLSNGGSIRLTGYVSSTIPYKVCWAEFVKSSKVGIL